MKPKLPFVLLLLASMLFGSFITKVADDKVITIEVIKQAEKILGLEFSAVEADSMTTKLTDNRASYERMRKFPLSNDVAPALYFNPLPVGFEFEKERKPFKASAIGKVLLPTNRDDLAFFTVRELAELIRTKQITSVELTKFFIERLKKYNATLLNVVSLTEELALKQAAQADAEIKAGQYKGLLHGIPYGAKDLLAVKNYKTTWGSGAHQDQTIDQNAVVIQRLEAAGAVLCAKLTMGELAMGDVWFGGKTKNPWDLKRGSSGSSAGSASAVAAGCLPFAIGTETLGSIVSPSTECGTTGLRPTFGRVPRTGAMALSWSMDKIGPICRSVEDCAIVFNTIQGVDGQDFTLMDASFNYNGTQLSLKGMRIGYVKKDFESRYPNKSSDSLTLATLQQLGAELVPMELPTFPARDMTLIIGVEGATAFDEMTRSNADDKLVQQWKWNWPNQFRSARFVPAVEYLQANRLRTQLIQDMDKRLREANVEVYITPSFSASGNLQITNLTGHPCVVLPNGFRAENRPVSITFMGKLFGEAKLLQVAKAYQDATTFHKKHPIL
ncbi:MAG: amidase [Spirosomataceae bacterium]